MCNEKEKRCDPATDQRTMISEIIMQKGSLECPIDRKSVIIICATSLQPYTSETYNNEQKHKTWQIIKLY